MSKKRGTLDSTAGRKLAASAALDVAVDEVEDLDAA